jgi:hypothetical protein
MIGKLIRFFVLVLLLPMIYAFTHEAFLFLRSNITFGLIQWPTLGFVVYLLIYTVFLKDRVEFFEGLRHELAHAISSLMLLQMPAGLVVRPSGEGVTQNTSGCFLAALAPYYLPIFTIPLLLLKPILISPIDKVLDFFIGFTLASHYVSVIRDFHLGQSDITKTGVIFSIVMTLFLNLIFLAIIMTVVVENYAGILDYFKNSFDRTIEAYKTSIEFLRTKTIPAIQDFLQR